MTRCHFTASYGVGGSKIMPRGELWLISVAEDGRFFFFVLGF
jgi:hypothetical protein